MNHHESLQPLRPAIFRGVPGLVAIQTTRKGGVSNPPFESLNLGLHTEDDRQKVERNLRLLCEHFGIPADSIILTTQVHGTAICRVALPGNLSGYDALITDTPGIYPGIVTADCYPVLIHDPEHRASGAAHAGWQGTVGEIARKTVEAMNAAFGSRPEACLAWVGTGISAERYEVDEAVASRFGARYLEASPGGKGKFLLDLSAANRDQLIAAGIPASRIECSPLCSSRDHELFFSYRRDHGSTGRMLSIIGVRPSA